MKPNFHRIWIVMEKPLVKQAPDPEKVPEYTIYITTS